MAWAFLLAALIAVGLAAALLGSFLYGRTVEKKKGAKSGRVPVDEALESPALLFTALSALGCVAGVAFTPWVILPAVAVAAAVAVTAPKRIAKQRRQARRQECERHLDMMCDIVAMGVDAGLSFDAALELYCNRFDNALSRELRKALDQWSHGLVGRREALENLADEIGSPVLKRFCDTVIHAVSRGAPLASMLRKHAMELRRTRRVRIERRVEKAPVKMLVPTGVCILPAMLLLVMGPMLLQFMNS